MNYNIKILVVEDFSVTRKMEIAILNALGFDDITEAVNGKEAIEKLKNEKDFDLIVSDWNMPHTNGYELLQWVRSDSHYHKIPFIMATAQAEKKEAAKAEQAGVSRLISKPYTMEEFQQIMLDIFYPEAEGEQAKQVNFASDIPSRKTPAGKIRLNVAHIQITDHLVLGVLNHLIKSEKLLPKYFELETRCMSGWNPVQRALEKGEVDAAFILAPIAMDMFSFGVPIQLILLAHKNGSICVRNKKHSIRPSFRKAFKNKVFYIPHVLSVHHMFAHMFFREIGLTAGLVGKKEPDVCFEVVPPVKIPEFMNKNTETCGFMVAQPIGAKTINEGAGELLFLSGELWAHHPCCVLAMQQEIIQNCEDAVYEFTEMLVQAGIFIEENPEIAARIAIDFLDPQRILRLSDPVLENVLTESFGIKTDDLYPDMDDFEKIQRYMVQKMGIGTLIDPEKCIDPRFAHEAVRQYGREKRNSMFKDPSFMIAKVRDRSRIN